MNEGPIEIKIEELQEVKKEKSIDLLDSLVYILKNRKNILWLLLFLFGGSLVEGNMGSEKDAENIVLTAETAELVYQINLMRHHFSDTPSSEVDETTLLILNLFIEGKISERECKTLLKHFTRPIHSPMVELEEAVP